MDGLVQGKDGYYYRVSARSGRWSSWQVVRYATPTKFLEYVGTRRSVRRLAEEELSQYV